MQIGLSELIQCFDGCGKLNLPVAKVNLEEAINNITGNLVKATAEQKEEKTEKTVVSKIS
jgi:hypothetical protein